MHLRSGYLGHTELWPQVIYFVFLLRQFLVHSRQMLTHHAKLTFVTFGGGLQLILKQWHHIVLNESIILFFNFFLLIFKHSQVALPLAEPDSETLSSVPLQLAFSPCLLSAVAYVEPVPTVNKIIRMYSCICTWTCIRVFEKLFISYVNLS